MIVEHVIANQEMTIHHLGLWDHLHRGPKYRTELFADMLEDNSIYLNSLFVLRKVRLHILCKGPSCVRLRSIECIRSSLPSQHLLIVFMISCLYRRYCSIYQRNHQSRSIGNYSNIHYIRCPSLRSSLFIDISSNISIVM